MPTVLVVDDLAAHRNLAGSLLARDSNCTVAYASNGKEALEKLAAKAHRKAELVKLRYFAGLTMEQTAETLGISLATANRWWNYARAWLHQEISGGGESA